MYSAYPIHHSGTIDYAGTAEMQLQKTILIVIVSSTLHHCLPAVYEQDTYSRGIIQFQYQNADETQQAMLRNYRRKGQIKMPIPDRPPS